MFSIGVDPVWNECNFFQLMIPIDVFSESHRKMAVLSSLLLVVDRRKCSKILKFAGKS